MNDIQIAYITDREMFWPSIVSMMSALEGTRSPVTVHFFGYQLSQEEFDHLMNAVRHWPETQVICHEVTEDMVEGAAINHYYPPSHCAHSHPAAAERKGPLSRRRHHCAWRHCGAF